MWLVAQTSSSWMFAAGVTLATFILLRRLWRRRRPASPAGLERGPRRDQPLYDAPPELLRWQVEMHELTRELKAELDSKIRVWNQLVQEAREERRRLEETLKSAKMETARRDSA